MTFHLFQGEQAPAGVVVATMLQTAGHPAGKKFADWHARSSGAMGCRLGSPRLLCWSLRLL